MARRGFAHLVMLVTTLGAPMPVARKTRPFRSSIVGSWLVTVEIDGGETLVMLCTFVPDGTVVSRQLPSSNGPMPTGGRAASGGVGAWQQCDGGGFSVASARLWSTRSGGNVTETFHWDLHVYAPGDVFGGTGAHRLVGRRGEPAVGRELTVSGTRLSDRRHGFMPPAGVTAA